MIRIVYVVTTGDRSDDSLEIEGIFSEQRLADRAVTALDAANPNAGDHSAFVEEIALDQLRSGMCPWCGRAG